MEDIFAKYQNYTVAPQTQQQLNQPLSDNTGFNEGHEDFLKMLIGKLESGELNPHSPATLYNRAVYDKLSESDQESADLTAINLMSMIRQIQVLWNMDHSATFQIQNLVETVFQMKSKYEEKHGDVYII